MRRIASFSLAAIAVAGLAGVLVLGSRGLVANAQGRGESPCIPTYKKVAEPSVILLGETVDITLHAAAVCAAETFPLHIVMVLDGSGSMAGAPSQEMKQAARDMVRKLDMDNNVGTQVGVVEFNSTAFTRCQLSNQEARVTGCIMGIGAAGGTRIDLGIEEGMRVLRQGRGRGADRDSIREVMIVLSDGGNNAGCDPVLRAAGEAKGQGILVITICVGAQCDASCMRRAATSPRYFFEATNTSQLGEIFERIRDEIVGIDLRRLDIEDVLPANMLYLEDVNQEDPPSWNPNERVLSWVANHVPKDGVTYTFRVEPQQVGYWPTNVEAKGTMLDNKSRSGEFFFEVPYVTVMNPNPLATPADPPTPPTHTPAPPPTVTITPTPRPRPIYLPINYKQICAVTERHADIVLMLDVSSSMSFPTSAGRSKIEAVVEASKAFVSAVDLSPSPLNQHGQVAVAGFNNTAWVETPLTNDLNELYAALDRLPAKMREYTRLDLAVITSGQAGLGANHKPENNVVIVLLTDGLPTRVPRAADGTMETTIIGHADALRLQGITNIYTIGVGVPDSENPNQRINPDLLRRIAGDGSRYFETADAEQVRDILQSFSTSTSCAKRVRRGD
jgi:Mg-chelatase subunit ChlD